ncbi:MAG: IS200/IS605 family transposase [Candidatus Pacebacteria bacterium]|nr:IS200/IS605 family transposase [Candidatus Paceibacterota bacterium]
MEHHLLIPHNKSLLIFHLVCPIKYRRKIFTEGNQTTFKSICSELAERYNFRFLEIGLDEDHAHFLIQTAPNILISHMVQTIKSITAIEMFKRHPEVKVFLWGGQFWTDGYYINTVGQYGNLGILKNYVKNQGIKWYIQIHQQTLFLS